MYPSPRDWETDCPDFAAGAQDRIHRYSGGDTPQGGFSRPSADLPSAPALRVHPHPPQCAHWGTFPLEGGRLGGRPGVPPLRRPLNHSGRVDLGPVQRVETCPLIRLAFARHLPPKGKAFGRPQGSPLRRIRKQQHFSRRGRSQTGPPGFVPGTLARQTQAQILDRTSSIFCTPRAQWPGGNPDRPLRFCAPEKMHGLSGGRPP